MDIDSRFKNLERKVERLEDTILTTPPPVKNTDSRFDKLERRVKNLEHKIFNPFSVNSTEHAFVNSEDPVYQKQESKWAKKNFDKLEEKFKKLPVNKEITPKVGGSQDAQDLLYKALEDRFNKLPRKENKFKIKRVDYDIFLKEIDKAKRETVFNVVKSLFKNRDFSVQIHDIHLRRGCRSSGSFVKIFKGNITDFKNKIESETDVIQNITIYWDKNSEEAFNGDGVLDIKYILLVEAPSLSEKREISLNDFVVVDVDKYDKNEKFRVIGVREKMIEIKSGVWIEREKVKKVN